MDADALAALMTSQCTCRAQVDAIRAARTKGEHYIDQARIIKYTPSFDGPTAADVLVLFNAGPGGLVDQDNHRVTSAPPAKGVHRYFMLRRVGGRWLIAAMEAV
jgi:hypothetical protein